MSRGNANDVLAANRSLPSFPQETAHRTEASESVEAMKCRGGMSDCQTVRVWQKALKTMSSEGHLNDQQILKIWQGSLYCHEFVIVTDDGKGGRTASGHMGTIEAAREYAEKRAGANPRIYQHPRRGQRNWQERTLT